MAIGAITPDAAGAVTAPSPAILLTAPSALSTTSRRFGLASWMAYPGRPGVIWSTGLDPMRHVLTGGVLRTGLLAPEVKPTTASGATASTRLDTDNGGAYTIVDGDYITLGGIFVFIVFKNTLGNPAAQISIKIGASGSETSGALENLKKAINGTGVEGVDYNGADLGTLQATYNATTLTTTDISIFTDATGTAYNTYGCTWTGGAGPRFEQEAANVAQTTFSGGTNASGTLPQVGGYYHAYSYYRSEDGAESGISPVSTRLATTVASNFSLSVLAAPDQDDDIDFKVWWRTFANGRSDALVEGYRIAEADTTDTDDLGNLSTDSPTLYAHQQYDASIHRSFKEGMIPRLRYMVPYKGMWFAGGIWRAAEYAINTCDVTNASNLVQLDTPALPTQNMEGRTFAIGSGADSATPYTIIWVDEANRRIYLDRDYEGTTQSNIAYTIKDNRDAFALYRCEPLKPNQTNGTMLFTGVSSSDPAGITGLAFAFESVLIFTKTGLSRLTGTGRDVLTTRITNEFEGAGCLSHHSIVYTGGAVYWLSGDGFYRWTVGQAKPDRISNPEGSTKGIAATFRRINLLHAHGVFGHYDQKKNLIRWLVPLDGETSNRYALAYDVTTGKWSGPLQYPDLTCIQTIYGTNGKPRNLAGSVSGTIYEIDTGNCDGYFGAESKATLTAATTTLLTASAATFNTAGDGVKGIPGILVRVATGAFEHFVCESGTGTTLTPVRPFSTAPAVGDVVMLGGIHWHPESGRTHFGSPGIKKQVGWVKTFFPPAVDGQVWQSSAAEQDDLALDASLDFTLADGEELAWSNKNGRYWKIAYDCIEPGMDPVLLGLGAQVNVPDRVRQ